MTLMLSDFMGMVLWTVVILAVGGVAAFVFRKWISKKIG